MFIRQARRCKMKMLNKIILSAERSDKNFTENNKATDALRNILDNMGLEFSVAIGTYKGSKEISFIVHNPTSEQAETLQKLAKDKFKQESIMQTDADGFADLIYTESGYREPAGFMMQVSRSEALKQDAYTHIGGEYFVAKLSKAPSKKLYSFKDLPREGKKRAISDYKKGWAETHDEPMLDTEVYEILSYDTDPMYTLDGVFDGEI